MKGTAFRVVKHPKMNPQCGEKQMSCQLARIASFEKRGGIYACEILKTRDLVGLLFFPCFDFQRSIVVTGREAFCQVSFHEGLDTAESLILGDVDEFMTDHA